MSASGLIATRIADRWLLAQEADEDASDEDGSEKGWDDFIKEVGDTEVQNPDNPGSKVKLLSLQRDKDHPKSKKLLTQKFREWKQKQEEDADEGGASEDGAEDTPLDIDPEDHQPSDDVSNFISDSEDGPVKEVHDDIKAGKAPSKKKVWHSVALVARALMRDDLSEPDLEQLKGIDDWLRELSGIAEKAMGGSKTKSTTPPRRKPTTVKKKVTDEDAAKAVTDKKKKEAPEPEGSEADKPADKTKPEEKKPKSEDADAEDWQEAWDNEASISDIKKQYIKDHPDEKDEVKAMSDDDLMEKLEAMMAKTALQRSVIRLAFTKVSLRSRLLPLLVR